MTGAPRDAGTVPVRVQVIDVDPRVVDLVVPTYLKADDLTQRIARDAGLGAWWDDGTRRQFWLRARGRLMAGHERLADLGVVPYELLHLLPEPPPGAPVVERPLGLPTAAPQRSRIASGAAWAGVLAFALLWAWGAHASPTSSVAFWPAVALCWWLGRALPQTPPDDVWGFVWRATLGCGLMAVGPVVAGALASRDAWSAGSFVVLAAAGAGVGSALAFLARLGPVADLPTASDDGETVHPAVGAPQASCGVCAGRVEANASAWCPYGCGRTFHAGCLRARRASAEAGTGCEMCGAEGVRLGQAGT